MGFLDMYANYSQLSYLNAIRLSAHGIESRNSLCADLVKVPNNYYQNPCTVYEPISESEVWRVRIDGNETNTIYNDGETDPQLKAALAHRLIIENMNPLIDDTDRKFLSFFCNAILRGDIDMLKQLFKVIADTMPQKLEPYTKALTKLFSDTNAGVCLRWISRDRILVHIYHGNCALAINPHTGSSSVIPIQTEWDGSVCVRSGEVIAPGCEKLMETIRNQALQRALLDHQNETRSGLPRVYEMAA